MDRPQVLVFIDWYLPGYKAGGPVRSLANLVDHLRDRVDFHIVTSDTEYTEHTPYPDILPDQWTTLPGGERVWYASARQAGRATWKRLLKERKWDAVYINGIYSPRYSVLPLWLSRGIVPLRVVAVRGMLASGALRHGALKKLTFLTLARAIGLYTNVRFQATNAEEAGDIRKLIARGADARVVPNLPRREARTPPSSRSKASGELRLVSVARVAPEKNTLFAIERLKGLRGQVRLDLFGPVYDAAYWAQCQAAIAQLPVNVQVELKGVVPPDSVPELLRSYHALLMPSAGENFGHTMLEALSNGLPLVISDRTPWKGLEAAHAGWDLPLDARERFTGVLQQLVDMDQPAYDVLCHGAFTRAARYLDDPSHVAQSLALFQP
ncbi:MAG: glycosyltransferase family 4 protein [Flavobacteriales bacterium]